MELLAESPPGVQLFPFSPAAALPVLRRMLTPALAQGPAEFGWKCFRAGRATELACQGRSIGFILQAGEWKSSAFLKYIDEQAVDEAQLLDMVLGAENDDD